MSAGHPTLLGGYHRPPGGPSRARAGLHAVSSGTDRYGARRTACGLVGRFLPVDQWEPFPLDGGLRCEKCADALADPAALAKAEAYR